ncbi:hypothetical protein Moror_13131 [Moniliophthora roreri MCA 2997]|uniref:Uncharacterized protein n=2 Tax=Moniliophthora roreri TaxID=221103 RepID=V2X5D2_MONRO|nr:hypothetical protein Moror_13131 [Moniliophthora roreri MCA 2997]KAI3618027.1 hypothetical protein WG66_005860 [Moniliophthora roreri]
MRCTSFVALAAVITVASAAPSTLEARKNVDRPDPTNLDHCPGRPIGDADACTFEKQSDLPDRRRWFRLGDPVANCDDPNAPDLSTQVGGERTTTETWTHTNKAEINLFGIKIGGEGGWEESSSKTERQLITVTIPKGKQRVVVAGVNHKESQGRIRLNYGDPTGEPGKNDYHYIWYQNDIVSSQPTDDVEYDSKEINCGETFDPNSL